MTPFIYASQWNGEGGLESDVTKFELNLSIKMLTQDCNWPFILPRNSHEKKTKFAINASSQKKFRRMINFDLTYNTCLSLWQKLKSHSHGPKCLGVKISQDKDSNYRNIFLVLMIYYMSCSSEKSSYFCQVTKSHYIFVIIL